MASTATTVMPAFAAWMTAGMMPFVSMATTMIPSTPSAMYVSTALFWAAGSLFALKMASSAPAPSAAFMAPSLSWLKNSAC